MNNTGQNNTELAIRKELESRGYKDIGYNENTKMVTIGGVDAIKPDYMDEDHGISYASADTINNGISAYRSAANDPAVRFTDRVAAKGGAYGIDAGAVGFSNGSVTLGGSRIKPDHIDESGKAWTSQSVVDNTVDNYISQTGLKNPADIYKNYVNNEQRELRRNVKDLQNRKAFSYDPSSDDVFQNYLKVYQAEGDRAAEDTAAKIAAHTGGYMNSSAVTAAALARNYYSEKAMSALPSFAQQAYQRYADDYTRDAQNYERLRALYESGYGREVDANTALLENLRYTAETNEERDRYNEKWNIERRKAENDIARSDIELQMLQDEAAWYPQKLDMDAKLQYQDWMQGDVTYQTSVANLRQALTKADYEALICNATLDYKRSQAEKNRQ